MMLWQSLSADMQDALVFLALLLPAAMIAGWVLRGHRPWPLVRAMLARFAWANALFLILIAVSIGITTGLLSQERALRGGTAAAADKFDLIVAAPGSEMTMLLAAVYLQPSDVGLVSGVTLAEIAGREDVRLAAPLGFGDSYGDSPVVGTTAAFVRHLGGSGIEGRMFETTDEAIAGAATGLGIGDHFEPAHGGGDAADPEAHAGFEIDIVGRLPPTGTPWDQALIVPIEQVWQVHGLADGHAPERAGQIGPPFDAAYVPGVPAVIVAADGLAATYALRSEFSRQSETMAFFPGTVLAQLFAVMGDVRRALSLVSLVTQVLVALSVLTSLLILARLFRRQLALLRAIGAPPRFVFAVVWSYAGVLLGLGAALGLVLGVGTAAILSRIVTARTDIALSASIGWPELHAVAAFLAAAAILALLPAANALRQPIIEGLRA